MKHRFKMKCYLCGTWTDEYVGIDEKIICNNCYPTATDKLKEIAELNAKYEQTSIFDFIDKKQEEK